VELRILAQSDTDAAALQVLHALCFCVLDYGCGIEAIEGAAAGAAMKQKGMNEEQNQNWKNKLSKSIWYNYVLSIAVNQPIYCGRTWCSARNEAICRAWPCSGRFCRV
jgi:hypothetical protein